MKIFCIIPAYNEEKKIKETIEKTLNFADFIVVINDFSSDKTLEELNKISSDKLKVLNHPINLGQGAALQTGNEYALKKGADIIVHFDADGQFLSEDIPRIVEPIIKGEADIVFGSRFMNIKSEIPKLKKNIIMPMAKMFNKFFFKIKTSDPQSGFRAMTKKCAEKIVIENNRMAHCTEILAKSFQYKFKIKEVPIKVIYEEFGQKFSGAINIIKDLSLKKIKG
jgi:glycosyltransferase involved in cell wall biosynthesis